MKRRYTNIKILSDVYCDSGCEYSFTAYCQDAKRRYKLEYSPGFGLIHWTKWGWPSAITFPKYVVDEIERLILEAYDQNRLSVHEIDREGNERRQDYRYHDDELLASSMACLRPATV